MLSLILNFLKRSVLVPLAVCAVVIAGVTVMPNVLFSGGGKSNGLSEVDISLYTAMQYDRFDQLESENYTGCLYSEDFSFGRVPVLYDVKSSKAAYVTKDSTEPWNGGSMMIIGRNTSMQLKPMHHAEIGNSISFDPYSDQVQQFTIKSKKTGVKEDELKKYLKKGKLIIAYPYNDFSDLGNAYYYTIFIAE